MLAIRCKVLEEEEEMRQPEELFQRKHHFKDQDVFFLDVSPIKNGASKAVPLLCITIIELIVFLNDLLSHWPDRSLYVWNPAKRNEVWRYFTFFFIHHSWVNFVSVIVTQVLVGLPMSLFYGSRPVLTLYLLGLLSSLVFHSLVDSDSCNCGAAGGSYALLVTYSFILNRETYQTVVHFCLILVFLISDLTDTISSRHNTQEPQVSYTFHISAIITGSLISPFCITSKNQRTKSQVFSFYLFLLLIGIGMVPLVFKYIKSAYFVS